MLLTLEYYIFIQIKKKKKSQNKTARTVKLGTFPQTNGQNSSSVVRSPRRRPERPLRRALWRGHRLLDVGQEASLGPGLRGGQQGELGQLRLQRGHRLVLRRGKTRRGEFLGSSRRSAARFLPDPLTCSATVRCRVSTSADFFKRSSRTIRSVSSSDVSLFSRDKINWTGDNKHGR